MLITKGVKGGLYNKSRNKSLLKCIAVCFGLSGCGQQSGSQITSLSLQIENIKKMSDAKEIYDALNSLSYTVKTHKENTININALLQDDADFVASLDSALMHLRDKYEERLSCKGLIESFRAEKTGKLPTVYADVLQIYQHVCDDQNWEQVFSEFEAQDSVRFTFYDVLEKQKIKLSDATKKAYKVKEDNKTYFIVAGTFKDIFSAKRLQNKFSENELSVELDKYISKRGIPLYRIQVGPYIGKRKVNAVQNKLASLGHVNTYLIHSTTKLD